MGGAHHLYNALSPTGSTVRNQGSACHKFIPGQGLQATVPQRNCEIKIKRENKTTTKKQHQTEYWEERCLEQSISATTVQFSLGFFYFISLKFLVLPTAKNLEVSCAFGLN